MKWLIWRHAPNSCIIALLASVRSGGVFLLFQKRWHYAESVLPASLILILGLGLPSFAQPIKVEKKELVQTKAKVKPTDSATSSKNWTRPISPEAPLVKIETIKRALADAKAKNDLLGTNF
jgi:thiol:disulfide interchange protein